MRVAINNTCMIVQFPYFDSFGFLNGKLERNPLAAMMLGDFLDSILGQSITLGSSPGLICMRVAFNQNLMIVRFPYFDCFGFIFGKIERSEMAAMLLAVRLDSI